MTIALVQLSDIHFRHADDPAVGRAQCIGSAIAAELGACTSTVVLAVCGDASFSGQMPQFDMLRRMFEEIEGSIRIRYRDIDIKRVIIPGNHDCDFNGDQAARDALLENLSGPGMPAASIMSILVEPLGRFFEFAEQCVGREYTLTREEPLYKAVDIDDGGAVLRLHLINTAWMSSKREQMGALRFPLDAIAPPASHADCSMAMLHHPPHWFGQPHSMRPLRDRLSQFASVVLVNHEHSSEGRDEELFMIKGLPSTRTVYVAGGALQDPDDRDLCVFNILHINLVEQDIVVSQHTLVAADRPYFQKTGEQRKSLKEHQLLLGAHGALLDAGFLEFLQDPGAPLRHPRRDPRIPIKLDDIYLFPDLWELDDNHKADGRKQVKSDRVAERLLASSRAIITGGDKSGRTALLKRLFSEAFRRGRVPVYVDGRRVPKDPSKVRAHIRRIVEGQYRNVSPDDFEQREEGARIALVDDMHLMPVSRSVRDAILDELERLCGSVILCSSDLLRIEELREHGLHGSHIWEYKHFVILGFGEHLREVFVRRWLGLGADSELSPEELASEADRICSLLNAVIKRQLLPTYPLFILLVLQQSDIAHASVQSGSFGKLFEGVVTAMLGASKFSRINISDKYFYLAWFARELFDRRVGGLSEMEARSWHRDYWGRIDVNVEYGDLLRDLESVGVLLSAGGEVRFKYAYFYCFFLAYNLSREIHRADSRAIVRKLAGQLHHRLSAEVVLFLAHLTNDPIVLDAMAETCERLFEGQAAADLGGEVSPLNRLGEVAATIEVSEDIDANRRVLREQADAEIAERMAATDSDQAMVAPVADSDHIRQLFDVHAAYKTIQILGQALRNVAASADRSRKAEVARKVVDLSRRLLGLHLGFVGKEELAEVMRDMASAHMDQQPSLARSEVSRQVCRDIWGLAQFVCFVVIRHVTLSMGSENLASTIERVLDGNAPVHNMLKLAFAMELPGEFPKKAAVDVFKGLHKNPFSASVVRILVAHHFYMYVESAPVRQSVCDQLDIRLMPSVLDASRKRLK